MSGGLNFIMGSTLGSVLFLGSVLILGCDERHNLHYLEFI